MKKITVIGSMSIDHVATADHFPKVGETLIGEKMTDQFGGKGANQAVTCARLGANVTMIGALGDDAIGEQIRNNFAENHVTDSIETIEGRISGQTLITVANGDNSIIVIPGTNHELTVSHLESHREELLTSDFVILQNEITLEVNKAVIDFCHDNQIKVIYNPAPAMPLDDEWIEKVDYLTPNETEFAAIFNNDEPETILKRYPNRLMITLGEKGVVYHDGEKLVECPAFQVDHVVDSTGAGDTFNGAFAIGLVNGLPFGEAIIFGQLAASLSIQVEGAQGGIPTLDELKDSPHFKTEWNDKF
ncbi:MAG: ribokinase [Aerococcus sp.]|nr:ribokinase [Aerococcus sp.]